MARLRILFFLLSSASIFLSACAYSKYSKVKSAGTEVITSAKLVPVIKPDQTSSKYKTSIDVLTKHFTGIIVLKQTDSLTQHMVFVTELGMRMFDFIIKGDSVKAEFVFDALNKPAFVNALTNNFRDILLISSLRKSAEFKSAKNKAYYWVKDGVNSIAIWKDARNFAQATKIFRGRKKHSKITYENDYQTIQFKQFGVVKIKIELNRINE